MYTYIIFFSYRAFLIYASSTSCPSGDSDPKINTHTHVYVRVLIPRLLFGCCIQCREICSPVKKLAEEKFWPDQCAREECLIGSDTP